MSSLFMANFHQSRAEEAAQIRKSEAEASAGRSGFSSVSGSRGRRGRGRGRARGKSRNGRSRGRGGHLPKSSPPAPPSSPAPPAPSSPAPPAPSSSSSSSSPSSSTLPKTKTALSSAGGHPPKSPRRVRPVVRTKTPSRPAPPSSSAPPPPPSTSAPSTSPPAPATAAAAVPPPPLPSTSSPSRHRTTTSTSSSQSSASTSSSSSSPSSSSAIIPRKNDTRKPKAKRGPPPSGYTRGGRVSNRRGERRRGLQKATRGREGLPSRSRSRSRGRSRSRSRIRHRGRWGRGRFRRRRRSRRWVCQEERNPILGRVRGRGRGRGRRSRSRGRVWRGGGRVHTRSRRGKRSGSRRGRGSSRFTRSARSRSRSRGKSRGQSRTRGRPVRAAPDLPPQSSHSHPTNPKNPKNMKKQPPIQDQSVRPKSPAPSSTNTPPLLSLSSPSSSPSASPSLSPDSSSAVVEPKSSKPKQKPPGGGAPPSIPAKRGRPAGRRRKVPLRAEQLHVEVEATVPVSVSESVSPGDKTEEEAAATKTGEIVEGPDVVDDSGDVVPDDTTLQDEDVPVATTLVVKETELEPPTMTTASPDPNGGESISNKPKPSNSDLPSSSNPFVTGELRKSDVSRQYYPIHGRMVSEDEFRSIAMIEPAVIDLAKSLYDERQFALLQSFRKVVSRIRIQLRCEEMGIRRYAGFVLFLFTDLLIFVERRRLQLHRSSKIFLVFAAVIDSVRVQENDELLLLIDAVFGGVRSHLNVKFASTELKEEWRELIAETIDHVDPLGLVGDSKNLSELAMQRIAEFSVVRKAARACEIEELKLKGVEREYALVVQKLKETEELLTQEGLKFARIQLQAHDLMVRLEERESEVASSHIQLKERFETVREKDELLVQIIGTVEALQEACGPLCMAEPPALPEFRYWNTETGGEEEEEEAGEGGKEEEEEEKD